MPTFNIDSGNATTFTDATPSTGLVIDFASLDNSFSVQINGVNLFVGGPTGAENELEFQTSGTAGQTVRFADGDQYAVNTPEVWQLSGTNENPIVRLEINPDGTIALYGVKANNGTLEPLELFNGLSVNTAAIDAAWNDSGPNTIVVDQAVTGPTNASGEIEDVPCFASNTLIQTLSGPVPIENLKVADQVLTYDNGYEAIRWIGSRRLSNAQLQANPKLKPILIRADALGQGHPARDLIVSPQHRVLVSSAIAKRMFDCKEVLIPANKLLPLDGIDILHENPDGVEYWHILLNNHEIVWSNGTPTESLFTGSQALKALPPESRIEIQTIFPKIFETTFEPTSARYIPKKGKLIKKLVQRHDVNRKPIYSSKLQQCASV
ncbi:Hint domain-containing protein [Sulfitobacter sp. F26169L]|uniref:Hint domain-containing protein n=1 Tax=Sulfitobacter sp. F26169L TaxID=2996015 RepID=UPI002260F014|nr:Hint domain-containing protein [Sulfitobacter sp. F26169L]MCX7565174.1 Hint domain-containing protein [Sulfitobacter sp. F26169L]